ncbi:MAG: YetF domain-containing protein [Bacteroidota bacterium]
MLVIFARTLILYFLVVLVMRLMGKRQIGQLQPFELVVAIMLSELAAVPMQDRDLPLSTGIIPMLTLLIAQIGLALLSLHSQWFRRLLCGTPSILIENGRIRQHELTRLRYNLNDLLEQLRAKNFANLEDVEFAVLETNGDLSIIPKSQHRPLTPADLNLPTRYEGLPLDLIVDGNINRDNLRRAGLDEDWLRGQLSRFGIASPREVFFATLDTEGHLYFTKKE